MKLPDFPMMADDNGCWIWPDHVDREGYGKATDGSPAHRAVWKVLVGEIAPGMELDHLCYVRACVNPVHLEEVTGAENRRRAAARRERCKQGHLWDEENTAIDSRGWRVCKACDRAKHRKKVLVT